LDITNHEKNHKNQAGESFLNPKKTQKMTNMQKQTKKPGLIKFLMRKLEADKRGEKP